MVGVEFRAGLTEPPRGVVDLKVPQHGHLFREIVIYQPETIFEK